MIPKTPDEMTALIRETMIIKLYTAITIAARRKRLTEHDIAFIEKSVFREFDIGQKVATEFTTFEAEPAIKKAIGIMQEFAERSRSTRVNEIAKNS